MPNGIGLYYPFIHFNDTWIKLAILYWDRIGRIVPEHYDTKDSKDVRDLQQVHKLVFDVPPVKGPKPQPESAPAIVGELFLAFVNQHAEKLRDQYRIKSMLDGHNLENWPEDVRTKQHAQRRHPRLAYIYNPKLAIDLTGALVTLGLAVTEWDNAGKDEWIGMHPKIAGVYMSALAEAMARMPDRQFVPLADDELSHLAASGWSIERLASVLFDDVSFEKPKHMPDEVEADLVHLAFSDVVPVDIASIDLDRILKVREKTLPKRLDFQEHVRQIVTSESWLQEITDDAAYRSHLDVLYEKRIAGHLAELESDMSLLGPVARRGVYSLLAKVPAVAAMSFPAFGVPVDPVVTSGAEMAGSVLRTFRPASTVHDSDATSVAYLLNLKHEFAPGNVVQRLGRRAQRATVRFLGEVGATE